MCYKIKRQTKSAIGDIQAYIFFQIMSRRKNEILCQKLHRKQTNTSENTGDYRSDNNNASDKLNFKDYFKVKT